MAGKAKEFTLLLARGGEDLSIEGRRKDDNITVSMSFWNSEQVAVNGRGGDDRVVVNGEPNKATQFSVKGGPGLDTLIGSPAREKLNGGAGHDILKGNGGSDQLSGGAGSDVLFAGKGRDVLFGGAGRDTFRFRPDQGENILRDFETGTDRVRLQGPGLKSIDFDDLDFHELGRHLTLVLDGGTIVFRGYDFASQLSPDDFGL